MIIIEGKAGKSRKLQEIINTLETDWCNTICMFDNVGIKTIVHNNLFIINVGIENDYDLLLSWSETSSGKYYENGWIIFEYNIPKELSDKFINMAKGHEELSIINGIIMTIQNNDLDEIIVYEI